MPFAFISSIIIASVGHMTASTRMTAVRGQLVVSFESVMEMASTA